ncbi:HypC/HybG/HupF family hydrogenase formation chaperone [Thermodesulfobacteriota bacterium]
MCIAIPSRIVAIDDQMATVDVQGARREVSLMLLQDEAAIDDYVLVHAGFAIQTIDRQAGEETLQLFEQILNQPT